MCGLGSAPKAPAPPPPPEPPKEAPTAVSEDVKQARTDERNAARAAAGRSGQVKTSTDLESDEPNKAKRTILG